MSKGHRALGLGTFMIGGEVITAGFLTYLSGFEFALIFALCFKLLLLRNVLKGFWSVGQSGRA